MRCVVGWCYWLGIWEGGEFRVRGKGNWMVWVLYVGLDVMSLVCLAESVVFGVQ